MFSVSVHFFPVSLCFPVAVHFPNITAFSSISADVLSISAFFPVSFRGGSRGMRRVLELPSDLGKKFFGDKSLFYCNFVYYHLNYSLSFYRELCTSPEIVISASMSRLTAVQRFYFRPCIEVLSNSPWLYCIAFYRLGMRSLCIATPLVTKPSI